MANIPCQFRSLCQDPANPFANTSAEAPDPNLFFGYNSFWSGLPPLDSIWSSTGCVSQCVSTVSQQAADICAANQQIVCSTTNSGTNMNGGWMNPGTGADYPLFPSDQESCTVNCPDGLPFTFTESVGFILGLNQPQADATSQSFACQQARFHKLCLGNLSQAEGCVNQPYSTTLAATGNTVDPLNTIWLNPGGGLPSGINMAFDVGGGTMTISGTCPVAGTYPFTIEVITPSGDTMTKNFQICIIDISPGTIPNATLGTAFSQQLTATSCAMPSLNWQVTAGTLPPGLTLNQETGIISGTPTSSGTFNFTVTFQTQAT